MKTIIPYINVLFSKLNIEVFEVVDRLSEKKSYTSTKKINSTRLKAPKIAA